MKTTKKTKLPFGFTDKKTHYEYKNFKIRLLYHKGEFPYFYDGDEKFKTDQYVIISPLGYDATGEHFPLSKCKSIIDELIKFGY